MYLFVWVFFPLLLLKGWVSYWRPSVNGYCPSCWVIILLRLLKQSFPQNLYWLVMEDKIRSYKKFNLRLYDFKRVGSKIQCILTELSWKLMLLLLFHRRVLCFNAEFKNVESSSWNCTLCIFEISPTPEYWKIFVLFFSYVEI